jgi:hypothetical protein
MASPAPYSKPRRGKKDTKTVAFRTARGSRIYAPNGGIVRKSDSGLTVTTSKGVVHKVTQSVPRKKLVGRRVKAGDYIGNARGTVVRYRRFTRNGNQIDAMSTAKGKNNRKSGAWLPNVKRKPNRGGGDMSSGGGSERKVVFHTTESGHGKGAINGVANWTTSQGISYHVLWNPWTGEFIQTFPTTVAARSLKNASGMATNRHGKVCIQVSIVGSASDRPLGGGSPMKGRRKLMQWLDGHGVPRKAIDNRKRSQSSWRQSGYHTHASCPGNDHNDPGRVTWSKVLAP